MRRWIFEQSLSLFFIAVFLLTLLGQSVAGLHEYNGEQQAHGEEPLSYWRYIVSSDFGGNVMENWQSEFLQFSLLILATVWLIQRGSTESKPPEDAGVETDQKARVLGYAADTGPRWAKVDDWRRRVYENSLLLAMAAIFFASWFVQSLTNWTEFNNHQLAHDNPRVTWAEYIGEGDFWNRTFQNWQSEFLAIFTMTTFSIYLRQRGSAESKPVGAPHSETGTSG
jgi:hypothetical protein